MNESQMLLYKSLENAILLLYLKIVIAFLFSRDKYVFQGQQRKNEKDISWYSHRGNFPSAINTKCQCSRLGDGPGYIRSNTRNL